MNIHYKPKVYTASKLCYAPLWIRLRSDWEPYVEFTSRWPDLVGGVEANPSFAREFWRHDIQDVVRADCVLVYSGDPKERLRGALVEAGAGIAQGKHVVIVGDNEDFGTWQFHPMVSRASDISEALLLIIGSWRS